VPLKLPDESSLVVSLKDTMINDGFFPATPTRYGPGGSRIKATQDHGSIDLTCHETLDELVCNEVLQLDDDKKDQAEMCMFLPSNYFLLIFQFYSLSFLYSIRDRLCVQAAVLCLSRTSTGEKALLGGGPASSVERIC